MQGHIRTATSLCLVLLALSLVGWPADVVPMALSDGQTLVGWLLHDTRGDHAPHPIQPQVTFTGLSDEPHTVTWFDDATGDEIARQEVDGTPMVVTAPTFE